MTTKTPMPTVAPTSQPGLPASAMQTGKRTVMTSEEMEAFLVVLLSSAHKSKSPRLMNGCTTSMAPDAVATPLPPAKRRVTG